MSNKTSDSKKEAPAIFLEEVVTMKIYKFRSLKKGIPFTQIRSTREVYDPKLEFTNEEYVELSSMKDPDPALVVKKVFFGSKIVKHTEDEIRLFESLSHERDE